MEHVLLKVSSVIIAVIAHISSFLKAMSCTQQQESMIHDHPDPTTFKRDISGIGEIADSLALQFGTGSRTMLLSSHGANAKGAQTAGGCGGCLKTSPRLGIHDLSR